MFCKKCNYVLSGNESFCPSCGTSQKKNGEIPKEPDTIFTADDTDTSSGIFDDDLPLIPQKKGSEKKKKSLSSYLLALVIILTVVTASAIVLSDYFDFAPSIDTIFSAVTGEKQTDTASDPTAVYDDSSATVKPEISYETNVAYVDSGADLIMRKGPAESYGAIGLFPDGTCVHITGGSKDSTFVYVYVPEEDVYGWLDSVYLSTGSPEEFTEVSTTQKQTETTTEAPTEQTTEKEAETEATTEKEPESTTEATTLKAPSELKVTALDEYTARVTAAQGVNFREGPSTDYKAISILGHGEEVTVKGKDEENPQWLFVSYKDTEGYINQSYLEKADK